MPLFSIFRVFGFLKSRINIDKLNLFIDLFSNIILTVYFGVDNPINIVFQSNHKFFLF